MKKTSISVIIFMVAFTTFASFSIAGTFDAGIVQDFIIRNSSYALQGDIRCSVTPNFEARLPLEFVYNSSSSMFSAGLSLAYYPFEKSGFFCTLSLISLGFIQPSSVTGQSNISLNELSFGYTQKFKKKFLIEGEIVIRDPSGTFGDEYDSLEEAFHCYKKFRVRLKAGYCFNFK